MLNLRSTFDLQKDVIQILERDYPAKGTEYSASSKVEGQVQIVHIERDGHILYEWKGTSETTSIGGYDPFTKQNKLLFTFDKEVCVISCSVNKERTLLAVSILQDKKRSAINKPLGAVSKCLTLLIEIHPINNTKVLKAVDSRVRVQFLYPHSDNTAVLESHLLLISEDSYIEQFHISLSTEEGYRVVIKNSDRLAKDRVAEDFTWAQWDTQAQRLFILVVTKQSCLKCIQFYPEHNFETLLEMPLVLPTNPTTTVRLVNFGYDHYQEEKKADEGLNMHILTSKRGSMCVCYSHPVRTTEEVSYTVAFVHRGYSKTFTVALEGAGAPLLNQMFCINLDFYVAVCLPGHYLHFINTRHPDLACHSLFLSGEDANIYSLNPNSTVLSLSEAMVLDVQAGKVFKASISQSSLLELLYKSRQDCHILAALHCAVIYLSSDADVELEIMRWMCDNVTRLGHFDHVQEFLLASLYGKIRLQSLCLDKVLPYTTMVHWEGEIPSVTCTTELLSQPVLREKARNLKGYWEELHWNMETMKYLDAVPNPRYKNNLISGEWTKLLAEMNAEEKKMSTQLRHVLENTKKVLSVVDTWCLDKRVVPLFQEEDNQQRVLIGLMVDKLREHLFRHVGHLGKKKIDTLVVNYVATLLELVRQILETMWIKYSLSFQVLCFKQQGSSAEWAVFHVMSKILEAAKGLCLPLPPGFHSLHTVLGVRCLPIHTFLLYIDHGVLHLTETFVTRLLKDLDNSEANEQLKFSIMNRLPESLGQKIYQLWDHPISSACIARNYVKNLLAKLQKKQSSYSTERERSFLQPEFLPLSYLAKTLSDVENQALNPFEEQENVDAHFVEEIALKQTFILMGFEEK
ncbi:gamma-secretase-activating protein isoform X2 [Acipenser oxyrinchus oxyrinchus]|uniref:Gamma-secretase-activating protein isoform X2 n=1 Tax=Acipenser oxyrinchus oxyrinchus TaxID=40147 RepID=A0AAD8DH96_ACIOX|nr:gamma-secretase-activating protein isoform X2 [Acipenser oxyrinchus oxyrinchus]